MIIGFRKRFLFVHIPKCAGDSIRELLLSPGNGGAEFLRKHKTFLDAERVMGSEIRAFTVFAVVRNPFAQVVSFYEHLRKPLRIPREEIGKQYPGTGGQLLPHWASELAMRLDFPSYVKAIYAAPAALPERPQETWFRDLLSWMVSVEGDIGVNRVLRFERLGEELAALAGELRIEGELPWRNASHEPRGQRDYRDRYDATSRRIIETRFAPTLERFGYSF